MISQTLFLIVLGLLVINIIFYTIIIIGIVIFNLIKNMATQRRDDYPLPLIK